MRNIAVVVLLACAALTGCAPTTEHIPAVQPFEIGRYTGMWYEIARLPNRWEEGLSFVTAQYLPGEEPETLRVINRGYHRERDEWHAATGKAWFAGDTDVGELIVTFRPPFKSAYRIIALDSAAYRYAMVTGERMSRLWILSRTPTLPKEVLRDLLGRARGWGFRIDRLITVRQMDRPPPVRLPTPEGDPATGSQTPKAPEPRP